MSRLQHAAAILRAAASATTAKGPWATAAAEPDGWVDVVTVALDADGYPSGVATAGVRDEGACLAEDGTYIALVDPTVGLALADLLDAAANSHIMSTPAMSSRATAVADAILRETWDATVAPGGYACTVCRVPVESEPCPQHGRTVP